MVNFADAPGDLARDGRSWTTVKDYAQWHEVARAITGHLIDRYGEAALDFTWSVFNEPDLGPLFWRADWDELQRFYDYTDRRHPAGLRGPRLRLEEGLHRRPGAGRDLRHEPEAARVPRPLLAPRPRPRAPCR